MEEATSEQIIVPEELDAEARLMARTAEEFLRKEVLPQRARLEAHDIGALRGLLEQAGQLGLLGMNLPEQWGGFDLPKTTATLVTEKIALDLSFAISLGVHSGVSLLPLYFFGTPEQKQTWLPRLASGEIIGAFALSEANSGSDALGAQTRATLAPDGRHYLLNGEKMWITNGGFADLFTVFAKVDGAQFTAFLVERNTPGLAVGREEHKLGLHGSSTCRLLLENVSVPVENVLLGVGKGHLCAFYALNAGRLHIGTTALGFAKETLRIAAQYAKQRVQFGKSIAQFGLIQHKLGEMALRILLLESMIYRVAGYWDNRMQAAASDADPAESTRAIAEEYALECALIKFFGTEVMDYVVDEALQIHGGFGFSEEFPLARAYRDARVFRIFEGTNEINRLTVADQIQRRIQKGRLKLPSSPAPLGKTRTHLSHLRTALVYVLEQMLHASTGSLTEPQEAAAALADMTATFFALESLGLRAGKLELSGQAGAILLRDAVSLYSSDAEAQIKLRGQEVLRAVAPEKVAAFTGLLSPDSDGDTISLRRKLAAAVLERDGYPC